jgi:hypothetical protein
MKKAFIAAATAAAAVGVVVVISSGGSAAAAGDRTLTFYEDASKEKVTNIDNAPKSPTGNPGSKRFRLSVGDRLESRFPILDRQGGNRIGTGFADAVVVKGNRFPNAVLLGEVVFKLGDDQLVFAGSLGDVASQGIAVIGGTGSYEGARGSASHVEAGNGSLDTVHLLP